MKKDVISKDIIQTLVIDIAKYILNFEIKSLEFIDKENQRVEDRRADVVAKVDNSYILHLEIQNNNDNTMPYRMMRYFTDIKLSDKKPIDKKYPIKQYLIYIGKDKLTMQNEVKGDGWTYKYNLIDMKNIDCEKFIKLDTPDALVLAILCDFKDKNEQDIVNYIVKRLYDLTGDNKKEFRKYMSMLEELSSNRDLEKNVKEGERMLTEVNYEKLPSYLLGFEIGEERGVEKGIEKGRIEGIEKGIEKGIIEGIEKGIEKGIIEGIEKGIEKGEKQKAIEIAKNLLDVLDSETIAIKTGLTIKDIEKLKIDMSKK